MNALRHSLDCLTIDSEIVPITFIETQYLFTPVYLGYHCVLNESIKQKPINIPAALPANCYISRYEMAINTRLWAIFSNCAVVCLNFPYLES